MVIGGRARTTIYEVDLSDRVPGFPGVYGAFALDTRKGPFTPYLVTSEADFLKRYTLYEKVQVGESLSMYEALFFLQKNDRLWVIRAENGAKYGGCLFAQDKPYNKVSVVFNDALFTVQLRYNLKAEKEIAEILWNTVSAGELCVFQLGNSEIDVLPDGIMKDTHYYLIPYNHDTYAYRLASSYDLAMNGDYLEFGGNEFGGDIQLFFGNDLVNSEVSNDITSPERYLMNTSDGRIAGVTSTFTVDMDNDQMAVSRAFYNSCNTGDEVIFDGKKEDMPNVAGGTALEPGDKVYIIKVPQEGGNEDKYKIQLARSVRDTKLGNYINFSSTGKDLSIYFEDKENTTTINRNQINIVTNTFAVSHAFYNMCKDGDPIRLTPSHPNRFPTVLGEALNADDTYYILKGDDDDVIELSRDPNGAERINITNVTNNDDYYLILTIIGRVARTTIELDLSNDSLLVGETFYDTVETGYTCKIWSDGTLPKGLSTSTLGRDSSPRTFYVIKDEEVKNVIKLASSKDNAELGVPVDIFDSGYLPEDAVEMGYYHHIQDTHNTLYTGFQENCLLITTKTPTAEDLYVTLQHYPYGTETSWTEADKLVARTLNEPYSFMLTVYKKWEDGSIEEIEKYLMSRKKDAKDGSGASLYCEDVIKRSSYVTLKDNTSISDEIYPCNQISLLKLARGYNGDIAGTSEMIRAIEKIANTRRYNCTIVMDGGYAINHYQNAIISLCESRMWTVGILSTPLDLELSANYRDDLIEYRYTTLNANTSHAAIYTPHLLVYDKYNNREIYVSPTGHIGGIISEVGNTQELWYPMAGNRRGVLNVSGLSRIFEDADEDLLYDANINPIDFDITKGIRVWGQKTLWRRNSALDRLNVRLLLCVIEPALKEFLDDFLFEINDEITRSLIEAGVTAYMDGIQSRRGVYAYSFSCGEELNTPEVIDSNLLRCVLIIQPTKAIEYIELRIGITSTGSNVSVTDV